MGYDRALAALNLEGTDRIPSFETVDHPDFIREVSGIDPYKHPIKAYAALYKRLDMDMALLVPTSNRIVNIGRRGAVVDADEKAAYTKWGVTASRWSMEEPFHTMEEILDYDPRQDPRLGVSENIISWRRAQEIVKETTLVPALYYTSLFMFLIMRDYKIGWRWLARLVYTRPKDLDKLLARFAEVSIRNVEAWSKEDVKVFIFHDDLASYNGLVMSSNWLREHVLRWYKKIWEPAKRKGIKVIFVSDGNYSLLIDDIVRLGADGLMIDHTVNLQEVGEKYGKDKLIIGNAGGGILTFGTEREVVSEVRRCVSQGGDCPGYFFKVGEDIPYNVPLSNVRAYFNACRKYGLRNPHPDIV